LFKSNLQQVNYILLFVYFFSFINNDFVIVSVSCIGILTYKSFISYIIILWFSLIFSFVKSWANIVEFLILY
jgi:hypothetical protein